MNKVNKKYALHNSYFKHTVYKDEYPKTPIEIVMYYLEYNELPFECSMDNWLYEMYNEYQKRNSVLYEQFLTPYNTVNRMIVLLNSNCVWYNESSVLEIGIGTGQITKELLNIEQYKGIDIDYKMIEINKLIFPEHQDKFIQMDFVNNSGKLIELNKCNKFDYIISNPPYSLIPELLETIYDVLDDNGYAVLLLPNGFLNKSRPKKLKEMIDKFNILYSEKNNEKFERTNINTELYLIEKKLDMV